MSYNTKKIWKFLIVYFLMLHLKGSIEIDLKSIFHLEFEYLRTKYYEILCWFKSLETINNFKTNHATDVLFFNFFLKDLFDEPNFYKLFGFYYFMKQKSLKFQNGLVCMKNFLSLEGTIQFNHFAYSNFNKIHFRFRSYIIFQRWRQ